MGNCCTTREREYGSDSPPIFEGGMTDHGEKKPKTEIQRSYTYIAKYFDECKQFLTLYLCLCRQRLTNAGSIFSKSRIEKLHWGFAFHYADHKDQDWSDICAYSHSEQSHQYSNGNAHFNEIYRETR